ncbi:EPIDERMAL PATTERNING FACTOR-like protein 8 [Senna tora]|uniref:Epidermal patterning factor-like protein n=1 Tax=Senna tora TaxID=362788 RepID=A0A834XFZ5_9FABA|nr:EPIDERMAL PATTERNING FACTOR-like protein 8 [Senna tora]
MAASLKVSISMLFFFTVALIFIYLTVFTTLVPPKSGLSGGEKEEGEEEEGKRVIGSKPPACENKCMKCRPCMATLVVPNNHRRKKKAFNFKVESRGDDDDTYYLLSWKCRCGNKLFQP